jgi:hypothetical protein
VPRQVSALERDKLALLGTFSQRTTADPEVSGRGDPDQEPRHWAHAATVHALSPRPHPTCEGVGPATSDPKNPAESLGSFLWWLWGGVVPLV